MTPEHRAGSLYHTGVGSLKKKNHFSPPFKPWLYGKTLPKASPAARAAQNPPAPTGGEVGARRQHSRSVKAWTHLFIEAQGLEQGVYVFKLSITKTF